MTILAIVLIIYGVFCLYIGLTKAPFIWKMKKLMVMRKMFGGETGLQIFIIIWGAIALGIGIWLY